MGTSERAECPDCGRDVAVNKDGTLRKHDCEPEQAVDLDVEQDAEFEQEADEVPADERASGGPVSGTAGLVGEHGSATYSPPRKDSRLCAVTGCDRPNVLHRLCGAHYASRRGDGS